MSLFTGAYCYAGNTFRQPSRTCSFAWPVSSLTSGAHSSAGNTSRLPPGTSYRTASYLFTIQGVFLCWNHLPSAFWDTDLCWDCIFHFCRGLCLCWKYLSSASWDFSESVSFPITEVYSYVGNESRSLSETNCGDLAFPRPLNANMSARAEFPTPAMYSVMVQTSLL